MEQNKSKSSIWKLSTIFILVVIVFGSLPAVSTVTWFVDDSGGADFTRIKDAVNGASEGDSIIVRDARTPRT